MREATNVEPTRARPSPRRETRGGAARDDDVGRRYRTHSANISRIADFDLLVMSSRNEVLPSQRRAFLSWSDLRVEIVKESNYRRIVANNG